MFTTSFTAKIAAKKILVKKIATKKIVAKKVAAKKVAAKKTAARRSGGKGPKPHPPGPRVRPGTLPKYKAPIMPLNGGAISHSTTSHAIVHCPVPSNPSGPGWPTCPNPPAPPPNQITNIAYPYLKGTKVVHKTLALKGTKTANNAIIHCPSKPNPNGPGHPACPEPRNSHFIIPPSGHNSFTGF